MNPAMGGKMKVLARRMSTNFQPRIPTSNGKRDTAHNDHAVKYATMVPMPAPARNRPAAMGKLTNGPPGDNPPATVHCSISDCRTSGQYGGANP